MGPYSQGLVMDNFVFVSGQLPIDPVTGNFVEGESAPARSCVQVAAIPRGAEIEIEAIARMR